MEINRNQYMMIGLVALFLGIQFRMVESVVLNQKTSEVIAKQINKRKNREIATGSWMTSFTAAAPAPATKRTVEPPKWLGWVMLSAGGILILHSLAMPRPSG